VLFGVDLLRDFFQTVIFTGRLKGDDCDPVSTMIIAEPERGKTSIVLEKYCESMVVLTDCTGKGLDFICQMNEKSTHVIINDMAVIQAHGGKAGAFFYSRLMAMTEEGIRAMATPAGFTSIQKGRRGFVGCITSTQAKDHRMSWYRRGLARRMVPFHFEYTRDMVLKIKEEIHNGRSGTFKSTEILKIPAAQIAVAIDKKVSEQIGFISDSRAYKLGELGISLLKNYRTLARAHALKRTWKKPEVNEEDIEFLKRIDPYVDWEKPALL
jgi:hypothetical protein